MKHRFLSLLANAINAYLLLDAESQHRLKRLQGRIFSIELLPFNITFNCHFDEKEMHIKTDSDEAAHTRIRGTPLQLLGLAFAKNNRQQFFADDVSIEGDAELGQQVIDLFDHVKIDWEEYLSQMVGDVPAYRAGQLAQKAKSWISQLGHSFTDNVREYAQEEARWLPTREELSDFFNDIDRLRMDTDRMEACIMQLKQQIEDQA